MHRRKRRAALLRNWRLTLLIGLFSFLAGVEVCRKHAAPPPRPAAKNLTEAELNGITVRYGAIFERAGGDGVWVKRSARRETVASPLPGHSREKSLPPRKRGARPRESVGPASAKAWGGNPATGEALAVPGAFQAIVSAFERQAERDGLRLIVASPPDAGSPRTRILTLSRASQPICAWRLREVAHLYRAAIVIDDLGGELPAARELLRLPYPLTFSVLPGLRASREVAGQAHTAGRQVMLHLPMEALPGAGADPGAGAIRVGMPASQVERIIGADLDSVPYAEGVNNHMGSSATSDAALMAEVMKTLAARRLYFIDSRTTVSSVALDAARQAGLPAFYRSVFLDDTQTVDYTLGQFRRFRAAILQQGVALAIGHPHPATITALEKFLPEFERDDIELVPASELVRLPEVARLSPPHRPGMANGD